MLGGCSSLDCAIALFSYLVSSPMSGKVDHSRPPQNLSFADSVLVDMHTEQMPAQLAASVGMRFSGLLQSCERGLAEPLCIY